jgi:xylulokinase
MTSVQLQCTYQNIGRFDLHACVSCLALSTDEQRTIYRTIRGPPPRCNSGAIPFKTPRRASFSTTMSSSQLFLGLDSSTQALKASLLSSTLDVISELEVRFDTDLAHFGTKGGVLHGPAGSGEVFSPVLQPVEALDLLFERIKAAGWDVGSVRGVAAAGQQHASVYWSQQASSILSLLDPAKPMAEQMRNAFSRDVIPNWQDSSTSAECDEMTAGIGGADELARVTGSSAHTRFTGSQIMRFRKLFPDAYAATDRISLVSSFITTLLCADGEIKGIDESDACGMNIWDMSTPERGWNGKLLEIIGKDGPELARKLGKVETDGGKVVGRIGDWFRQRYGFSRECAVFPGTGDNPATFLSLVCECIHR